MTVEERAHRYANKLTLDEFQRLLLTSFFIDALREQIEDCAALADRHENALMGNSKRATRRGDLDVGSTYVREANVIKSVARAIRGLADVKFEEA